MAAPNEFGDDPDDYTQDVETPQVAKFLAPWVGDLDDAYAMDDALQGAEDAANERAEGPEGDPSLAEAAEEAIVYAHEEIAEQLEHLASAEQITEVCEAVSAAY